ncbi:MAG: ABC transporter permease [Steroidobacteraceae bacterium]
MTSYYVRLAIMSFKRNPGLTALMVLAIGLGIAVCVITLTMYRAMAGNPIWWKDSRLYAVTLDSWDPQEAADEDKPHLPPPQLTYKDAIALYASDIPERKLIMYIAPGVMAGGTAERKPVRANARLTTADFFSMFETPFLYGSGWNEAADAGPEPVIVLGKAQNDTLFGGENSVGRTVRWNDREFRIIGVLDGWMPLPKWYDLNNGSLNEGEDVYVPFRWGPNLELFSGGSTNCWKPELVENYAQFLGSECVWIQMWVELPSADARARMRSYIDGYVSEQRKAGRFERPLNNRLTPPSQWLIDNEVVSSDNRVLVGLAFAFLAVCLINTVGLLLAKFLNGATIAGVRRALGASRRHIFLQHLTEVGVVAVAGALFGLVLGALGLWGLRALYADPTRAGGYQAVAYVDTTSVIAALVLAVVAAIAAGLYPAWRIGRLPPASYLKSQ